MLSIRDKEILNRVFSDAHVLDFDLSRWDKLIEMWLLADHYKEWQYRCPLVVVGFLRVAALQIRFSDQNVELPDNEHIQWRVYRCSIIDNNNSITTCFSGPPSSPRIEIISSSITIREAPHSVLDSLQPDWNHPSSPLARRSIDELSKRIVSLRKNRDVQG